jgi:hypothetical protein
MAIISSEKPYDLTGQQANVEQTLAELALIQQHEIDVIEDPKLYASPAILIAKLLGGFTVLFFAGVAIGTLL